MTYASLTDEKEDIHPTHLSYKPHNAHQLSTPHPPASAMSQPTTTTSSSTKQRKPPPPTNNTTQSTTTQNGTLHLHRQPSIDEVMGAPKHGKAMQGLRIIAFGIYFFSSCLFIHFAQLLGLPLYLLSRSWFNAYMVLTKQYFGLLVTTMTQWWSPTLVRISGDASMAGLLKQNSEGMLEVNFGERAVLMANHQIYTDWLYLWWTAYTNTTPTHGHIYIILKESLKWVPIIGPAMQFYGFVFMARKWATDQKRLRDRLQKLNTQHSKTPLSSTGEQHLDPMWLLIFPEGTNLSANTRNSSTKFAEKENIPDMRHLLLPRSTGLQLCLQELKNTVPYIYDCTIAYEGIPPGAYGQDIFTLRSVYFQGRPPKSANMHWRRYAIASLPLDDHDAMYDWLMARWREKDELIEAFLRTGKFVPADPAAVEIEGAPREKEWKSKYISTQVMPRFGGEFLQMFAPVLVAAVLGWLGVRGLDWVFGKEAWFGGG